MERLRGVAAVGKALKEKSSVLQNLQTVPLGCRYVIDFPFLMFDDSIDTLFILMLLDSFSKLILIMVWKLLDFDSNV